jgi:Raf kinase inhibitor-like YbhB/YbcL family protein
MSLQLMTDAFAPDQQIPKRYTKEGENISPALSWQGEPAQTRSFAVVVEDPDAPKGTFTHWVCYNIPAQTHELPPGVSRRGTPGEEMAQGRNDFGNVGYDGAQPPPGPPHHYHFALYALDTRLPLSGNATKDEVLDAIQGHVLDQAELVGLYQHEGN